MNVKNNEYNLFTQKIINKLPYWMQIRKNNEHSTGAMFLNVFGLELKDIYDILTYAYEQVYIDTVDLNQINILFKAFLDSYVDVNKIQEIKANGNVIEKTDDIDKLLNNKNFYYLDEKRKIAYFSEPYDKNSKYKYGYVDIKYNNIIKRTSLELHHVWNFLDEFGFLLDCKRLFNENNYDYKNRILDVFKSPASSTMDGMLNAISRELGTRKYMTWIDGSNDFIISDKMVTLNKIKVDNEYIALENITLNEKNEIILAGDDEYKNIVREVCYSSGIEMHQMHNREDEKLKYEFFEANGFATKLLKDYSEKLKSIIPIKWGYFVWDESFYDLNELDISGEGFIPSFYDASIEGFKGYIQGGSNVKL